MDKELIHILKVVNILDHEKIIIKMDKVQKFSLMEVLIKDNTIKVSNMVKEYFYGLIQPNILGISLKIIYTDTEFMNEPMGDNMKESGNLIKWMEKENLNDLMGGFM